MHQHPSNALSATIDTSAPTITVSSIAGDNVGASDNGIYDGVERGANMRAHCTTRRAAQTSVDSRPPRDRVARNVRNSTAHSQVPPSAAAARCTMATTLQ